MSTPSDLKRSGAASSESRLHNEETVLNAQIEEFFNEDKVSSLSELNKKLSKSTLPCSFLSTLTDVFLMLFSLETNVVPTISSALCIYNDLSWSASIRQQPLKPSNLPLLSEKVDNITSILNSMANLA